MKKQKFKQHLGRFATGITVITTHYQGENYGITVNSFASLSLEPPLVLFSIDQKSHRLDIFNKAQHFCINILASDQAEVSNLFASHDHDQFKHVKFRHGHNKLPIIKDCLTHMECRLHQKYNVGDHVIFTVETENFGEIADNKEPLIYYNGKYESL